MAQSSSVRIGWTVMLIMGIYIVILGLAWTLATEAMSGPVLLHLKEI